VRSLRALRPDVGAPAALPDSPAWRAWLSATAAIAGTADSADDPIARFVVCAAATALADDDYSPAVPVAVAAGVRAAALVESRLIAATDPAGWSVPTVSAVIGAGVAAGLMLRLPSAGLRHTLGICATQAAGLHAAAGTDAGPLQAGKAAFNAVEAAHLARLGFTSSGDALDGRRALFALFAD
jgi:2-methylcitrate dehydratase PrpD